MAGRAATAVKSRPKTTTKAKATTKAKSTVKVTRSKAKVADDNASLTSKIVNTETKPTEVEVAKPKTRRKSKTETRTLIYWAVFNPSLKRVAVFEFDQKGEAEKRAAKLTESSGEQHFIQKIKATKQV